MTEHEQIMVCAERYALGRRTYVVSTVTQYIESHIDGMSDHCKEVLIEDIEHPLVVNDYGLAVYDYGDLRNKVDWMRLLRKLKGEEE